MPWSKQDASGELAAMAIGASLWGADNQTGEFGANLTKPGFVGTRYGYVNLQWQPGSAVFNKAGAAGLPVRNWQDLILVNMLGKRFYDETGPQFPSNDYNTINPYAPWSTEERRREVPPDQLAQRRDGRDRRRPQRRRPDLGDLRRGCGHP